MKEQIPDTSSRPAPASHLRSQRRRAAFWVVAFVTLLTLVGVVLSTRPSGSQPVVALSDGTEFELMMVAYTNAYNYTQVNGAGWIRRHANLIPDFIEKRFLTRGGGIGMGTSSETNLMVVIESRSPGNSTPSLVWLRVSDDASNSFEGNFSNGVLSSGGNQTTVWRLSTFPRRTGHLHLTGLVLQKRGIWTNIGPFQIENPLFNQYPQWQAEPLPQTARSADVRMTLHRLLSGRPPSRSRSAADSESGPRVTRLEFSFDDDGNPAAEYRLHSVTFSDATGNRWSPSLSPFHQNGRGWTTNGVAECVGALWPGEDAWKIDVRALQISGFTPEEIHELPPISLPNAGTHEEPGEAFQEGDVSVQIANVVAPGVELTDSWRWIVRYWRNEPSVYGVGVAIDGTPNDRRLVVVEAKDQDGNDFKLVEHRGIDHPQQALFFQAHATATDLRLKLAFPKWKEFGFLARPDFAVQESPTSDK